MPCGWFLREEARYRGRHNQHNHLRIEKRLKGMKTTFNTDRWMSGKIGWLLLWLVGIPVPILLILFLLRGCT